jgi:hypothetical protein
MNIEFTVEELININKAILERLPKNNKTTSQIKAEINATYDKNKNHPEKFNQTYTLNNGQFVHLIHKSLPKIKEILNEIENTKDLNELKRVECYKQNKQNKKYNNLNETDYDNLNQKCIADISKKIEYLKTINNKIPQLSSEYTFTYEGNSYANTDGTVIHVNEYDDILGGKSKKSRRRRNITHNKSRKNHRKSYRRRR